MHDEYCVCIGNLFCESGSLWTQCDLNRTSLGSARTNEIMIAVNDLDTFWHNNITIDNLVQRSKVPGGFGVRVSASNSQGFGIPCAASYLKPIGLPDPPSLVETHRDASSSTVLIVHFTLILDPNDRGSEIHSCLIEWSDEIDFSQDVRNATISVNSALDDRLPNYKNMNSIFNLHRITGLIAGTPYFVRIAGINSVGVGSGMSSTPLFLAPGMKPESLDEMNGVSVSVIKADTSVSVAESSTSLVLRWRESPDFNGFAPSHYLIEYWTLPRIHEVHKITLLSVWHFCFNFCECHN